MTYIIIFLGSILTALAITPIIIRLAHRLKILDAPNPDNPGKIHKKPTALMGGLSIYFSILIFACIFLMIDLKLLGIFLAMSVIVILGIFDDIRNLDYKFRLFVQFGVALFICLGLGIKIGFLQEYPIFNIPLTLLWIVGVTNALNLMDNVDGATAGVSFFASAGLFLFAAIHGDFIAAVLALTIAGACIGFLFYNFKPASIFLGDTGSLLLGISLATISLLETEYLTLSINHIFILPFIIGVPIYDTTLATSLRLYNRRPIYLADKSNLTYRLFGFGFTQLETVFIEYGMAIFFVSSAFMLWWVSPLTSLLIISLVIGIFTYLGYRFALVPVPLPTNFKANNSAAFERRHITLTHSKAPQLQPKLMTHTIEN